MNGTDKYAETDAGSQVLTHCFFERIASGTHRARKDMSGNSDQSTSNAGSLNARHVLANLARAQVEDRLW